MLVKVKIATKQKYYLIILCTILATTGEQKSKVTFDPKLLGTEIEAKKLNKSEDYFISDVEQFKKKLVFIDGR